jgi:hypothetical protein
LTTGAKGRKADGVSATEKLFAFVLMPFEGRFDDVYRLGIKAAVEELGMIATRVDEQVFHKEGILERIYNQIDSADFIIADMSGRNPNVFYEVGYAHAKQKTCILLTENAADIPFDLKHQRHIVYGNSIVGLKRKLTIDLATVKVELEARESPIHVELGKISGDLTNTKYSSTATVDIYLDIHNRSTNNSPEIETIYFYTGKGWRFTQDNQECLNTISDLTEYKLRHLIRSPVRRVIKGSWSQVKLVGQKVLAYSFDGEELKDSYRLTGRAVVRVITATETFENIINLEVAVDETPF